MIERFIPAGEIVNLHGVRGEVKIQPWLDSAEQLAEFQTLYMDGKAVRVLSSRVHGSMLLARLEGVEDADAALALRGVKVSIDRADAKLPEGGFFVQDIIGALVVTEEGEELGRVAEAIDAPAHMVYVVRGERERLIPAIPQFVLRTEPERGVVTVRLIDGM